MDREETEEPLFEWVRGRFKFIEGVGEYVRMCLDVVKVSGKKPPALKLLLQQLYDIGATSLPVVAFTGFFTGLVLAAQAIYQLSDKGLVGITGLMVAKAMITELGPVLTAFMVTGTRRSRHVRRARHHESHRTNRRARNHGRQPQTVSHCSPLNCRSLYDAASHHFLYGHGNFWRISHRGFLLPYGAGHLLRSHADAYHHVRPSDRNRESFCFWSAYHDHFML